MTQKKLKVFTHLGPVHPQYNSEALCNHQELFQETMMMTRLCQAFELFETLELSFQIQQLAFCRHY